MRNHFPQFGSPLAQLLFEPADITTASLIASEIKQVIDNYEKSFPELKEL